MTTVATHVAVAAPLAVGAGGAFAVANVAQTMAARRVDAPSQLNAHLLIRLLRDKLWLTGLVASAAAYMMQAVALFLAPVVFVQPLIVSELILALPLAARNAGRRLGRREWTGAALVAAGLALFVVVGRPSGTGVEVATSDWITWGIAAVIALAALIGFGESRIEHPSLRATALAVAASICFGFMAVLTRVVFHSFADHGIVALARPEPYGLPVLAIGGLLLSQTAFRIAPLSVSLPVIDVGEPAVASVLGVVLLGESLSLTVGALVAIAVAGAAVVLGVVLLDFSPLVQSVQADINAQLVDLAETPKPVNAAVGG